MERLTRVSWTVYFRFDGDGHGDPSEPINNCGDDLTRYANNQLDCDDYNPAVNLMLLRFAM